MLSAGQDLACPRCSARFFWPVCSLYRSVHACCCYAHKASFFFSQCLGVMWSVTQLCPTLCDPMDYSLPGSSVHGIFQARILECIVISFSRGSSQPRDWTRISGILCTGRLFLYSHIFLVSTLLIILPHIFVISDTVFFIFRQSIWVFFF